jgi:hypothetical protein
VLFEAAVAPSAVAVSADVIAPSAPANVVVSLTEVTAEDGTVIPALRITWTDPLEEDVAGFVLYRSTQFGTRGDSLGELVTGNPEYIDTTAPRNTPVYYTLVSRDLAGNMSSDDFQSPVPGNLSPFTPFGTDADETN